MYVYAEDFLKRQTFKSNHRMALEFDWRCSRRILDLYLSNDKRVSDGSCFGR
jgi:hypothetical protein